MPNLHTPERFEHESRLDYAIRRLLSREANNRLRFGVPPTLFHQRGDGVSPGFRKSQKTKKD